jgi:hypothetical protein
MFCPTMSHKNRPTPYFFFISQIDSLLHSKSCQPICMVQVGLEHVFLRHQIPLRVLIYPKSRSEGPQPRTFFYCLNRFSGQFQVMPAHLHGPGRLGTCFSQTSNTPPSAHLPQISVRGSTRPNFFLLSKMILLIIPSHASSSAWSRHAWNMFFSDTKYPSECTFTPNLGQRVHKTVLFFIV